MEENDEIFIGTEDRGNYANNINLSNFTNDENMLDHLASGSKYQIIKIYRQQFCDWKY